MKTKKLVLGLLAHVDAGKTTLAEAILYQCGSIRRAGRVDHGNAHLDTHEYSKIFFTCFGFGIYPALRDCSTI